MSVSRTDIARVLRKEGFPASKSVGRGFTSGYESWNFGDQVFVTYHRGTGNSSASDGEWISERNGAIAGVLREAGFRVEMEEDRLRVSSPEK